MHAINIYLDPNDGATRIAVQALDGELEKVNAACGREAPLGEKVNSLQGPGIIFAQVFPQMLENGGVLGVNLKAVVLDHQTGLKIKACLCEARRQALLNQGTCNA